jgi:XTP/dITP diphosphohydrolase
MEKLVFATHNKHKLEEVKAILQAGINLLSLKDIECLEDIPETADSLEGNALLKAEHIYKNYGYNCFAEDTGLEVEALNNRPGVHSARYAGEGHDSQQNMEKLLHDLEGVENRNAQFRTVIALIEDGEVHYFEGIIKGKITTELSGNGGFGYDPIFMPDGYTQTFAELGKDLKNKISHRALAIEKLKRYIND